jgi:hypothetical protein
MKWCVKILIAVNFEVSKKILFYLKWVLNNSSGWNTVQVRFYIQSVQLLYSISLLQTRVVAKEKRNCWSDLGIKTNNSFRLCNRDMLLCGKSACFAYLILKQYIVLSPLCSNLRHGIPANGREKCDKAVSHFLFYI